MKAIAGYGTGTVELDQGNYETELLDGSHVTFGVSGRHLLYSSDSLFHGGVSELTLKGETWLVSQYISGNMDVIGDIRTDARHLRVPTVGTQKHAFESGVSVNPSVSMGLREDGKRGKSFLGMEFGGGIDFTNSHGHEISSRGEVLFAGTEKAQE